MAARRTTATTTKAKSALARKPARAPAPRTKKVSAKKTAPRKRATPARATLSSLAAQVTALAEQLEMLTALVRSQGARPSSGEDGAEVAPPPRVTPGAADKRAALSSFETDLLRCVAELDRRGRHTGMVPIPDLRSAFLARGWTRGEFDERLLQAERDFIVDLKTANDPSRLTEPELAIEERGRGHLQFVVIR